MCTLKYKTSLKKFVINGDSQIIYNDKRIKKKSYVVRWQK